MSTPYGLKFGGGLENYVVQLSRSLKQYEDIDVVIVHTERRSGPAKRTEDTGGLVTYTLPSFGTWSRTPLGLGWSRAIRRIVADEEIAVVNGHAPVPGMAEAAARAVGQLPFVLTYHAGPMRKGRLMTDFPIWLYETAGLRFTARRADQIITSSDFVRDSFISHFGMHSHTIPPGVDSSLFSPTSKGLGSRLLFVGALGETGVQKGLSDLLCAMALAGSSVVDLGLAVIGGGDDSRFRRLAAELGLSNSVEFLGSMDHARLSKEYQLSRALVLPTYNDSFPMVVLEAMASGLPVITTDVGALPQLVKPTQSGIILKPGDVPSLASALVLLSSDLNTAQLMGGRGRACAIDLLGWEQRARATAGVYRDALKSRTSQRRTRIAVVSGHYAPKIGGLERYAARVARAVQAESDFETIVITTTTGLRRRWSMVDGVPVLALGTMAIWSNTPLNPCWLWQYPLVLRRLNIDLVQVHSPVPGLADVAMLMSGRRKKVLTYHAGSMVKGHGSALVDRLLRLYEGTLLPRIFGAADELVSVSPTSLAARFPGSRMVTPGVDMEFVNHPRTRPTGRQPYLLYVGRMDRSSPWKGVNYLIEAFAQVQADIPGLELWLVGAGDGVGDLRRLVGLASCEGVLFKGILLGIDLVEAYSNASVVVLPSTTDAESFGMCLVEGMACGVPVVASAVGGPRGIITDSVEGFLVRPADVGALAESCRILLADEELQTALGKAGREKVLAEYLWSTQVRIYLDLYRRLRPAELPF